MICPEWAFGNAETDSQLDFFVASIATEKPVYSDAGEGRGESKTMEMPMAGMGIPSGITEKS